MSLLVGTTVLAFLLLSCIGVSYSIPGNDEISTTTELVLFQQATIDRHVSGLTVNTSTKVRAGFLTHQIR